MQVASRAFKNTTSFDYMVFITQMQPAKQSLRRYFDINRMMKLRDKFDEPGVISILENVVDKLILISEQVNCFEFINKSKTHLIEQAS